MRNLLNRLRFKVAKLIFCVFYVALRSCWQPRTTSNLAKVSAYYMFMFRVCENQEHVCYANIYYKQRS